MSASISEKSIYCKPISPKSALQNWHCGDRHCKTGTAENWHCEMLPCVAGSFGCANHTNRDFALNLNYSGTMFHGQPFCKQCGYGGPNFMWSYHHYMGFSVLLRDKRTNALRTIHIDDRDEFCDCTKTDDELELVFEKHIDEAVVQCASETEERVDVVKFAFNVDSPTTLKCPECSEMLHWRSTGIS